MKAIILSCLLLLGAQASASAQEQRNFESAAASLQEQLEASINELSSLRESMSAEQIPLNARLRKLEAELSEARAELKQSTRLLDSRTLDLSNLRGEIKRRADEATYISDMLSEYSRNFESRLHIAEIQRYRETIEAAKLAPENSNLSEEQIFATQVTVLNCALDRILESLGGTHFEGTAVDAEGVVRKGTFALVGPSALFRSSDGISLGTAEQRIGSLEPSIVAFTDPESIQAAEHFVLTGNGSFPFDPTLGKAHKIAATEETFWEHVQQGGAVMVPIFLLASAALMIALIKWIGMLFLRKPSTKGMRALLSAVEACDEPLAREQAALIKGPTGKMLSAAVEHLREPRELLEEIMYEQVLKTKLKLQRFLPFIAISAASAPLLGLLGTVTGIINTFKLITVFGSGDVKTLSSGISEALITTKFGLIVAIPSLLLHAFLSRKARGVVAQMETSAIALANQVSKTPQGRRQRANQASSGAGNLAPDPAMVRDQVNEILGDLLGPLSSGEPSSKNPRTTSTR